MSLRSTRTQTLGDEVFSGRDVFECGMLPTEKEVIEMMIWVMAPRDGKVAVSMATSARMVAGIMMQHWIWSNVYPKKLQNVQKQIEKLYLEFKKLKSTSKLKQTENWKKEKVGLFLERIKKGMDISTYDSKYLALLESECGPYGIKMTEEDRIYKDDQVSGPRKMYCETFADKRWLATMERKKLNEEKLAMAELKDEADQAKLFNKVALTDEMVGLKDKEVVEPMDEEYVDQEDSENNINTTRKRRKSGIKDKMTLTFADMPKDCQHIRHSVKHVRAEYYTTVDELMSVYHMSY